MRIIFDKDNQPKTQADPFVFAYGDKYYIFTSGLKGVHAYSSDRLDGDWEYLGIVYKRESRKEYWAPCIYEENGILYLYVSTAHASSTDSHDECIEVAVAQDPQGSFHFLKELLPSFSIDPHVVKSGEELFMFYSVNDYEAERAGTYIVVQKMGSPKEMMGEPVPVLRPTLDEEIFQRDRFKKGQHWHTLEGAFYFREGDDHFLIYSGNCWMSKYYYLGYARAHTTETDLTKVSFKKYPSENIYSPLIAKNAEEDGTGHNSMIKIDGTYWCVYHGRNVGDRKAYDNRSARICKIEVRNGILKVLQ